jgi:hypothetical protein
MLALAMEFSRYVFRHLVDAYAVLTLAGQWPAVRRDGLEGA